MVNVALIGNPNCGKTTLFNRLTGCKQDVGNWPGVTNSIEYGFFNYQEIKMNIADLPGLYSLFTKSPEQEIVARFLMQQPPDVVINVVDSTNLERNLYLSYQLKETNIPMVVALNMEDELLRSGDKIDIQELSMLIAAPCVSISAVNGKGIDELINIVSTKLKNRGVVKRHLTYDFFERNDSDKSSLTARYDQIKNIVSQVLQRNANAAYITKTICIDKVLCQSLWSLPLFVLLMLIIFYLCFGPPGSAVSSVFEWFFDEVISSAANRFFLYLHMHPRLISLLMEGIFTGVTSVISFVPQLAMLFFFLSVLEYSGYMTRAAFLTDRLFAHLGLSGACFIPMCLGFGCSVPGIMSCRMLPRQWERRTTMSVIPFISCSARMPVYALIAGVFFPDQKWLVISSLYFLGIAIALISVGIRNKMSGQKDKINFVMEMPPYRFPDMAYVFHHLWIRVWDFLSRVGSVILLASVVMWLLSNLTIDFHFTGVADESLLAHVGQNIAFVFSPLGFGYWEIAVALLSGLMAKEAIISSLGVLLSYGNAGVDASLLAMISPAAAYALLVFVLLYPPCIAAFAAMRNESNSWSFAVKICLHQLAIAWLSSFVIFRIIQFLF